MYGVGLMADYTLQKMIDLVMIIDIVIETLQRKHRDRSEIASVSGETTSGVLIHGNEVLKEKSQLTEFCSQ